MKLLISNYGFSTGLPYILEKIQKITCAVQNLWCKCQYGSSGDAMERHAMEYAWSCTLMVSLHACMPTSALCQNLHGVPLMV